jgi:hypothetical protein
MVESQGLFLVYFSCGFWDLLSSFKGPASTGTRADTENYRQGDQQHHDADQNERPSVPPEGGEEGHDQPF